MNAEKALEQLVDRLLQTYGRDLRSVVLYGSGAGDDFDEKHSDLNVLCVLRDVAVDNLEKAEATANWWRGWGHPAPLLFAEGEMDRASDAFPIEFLDIRDKHRVLHGDDPTTAISIDPGLHRTQVEHELRARLMALRQRYLGIYRNKTAVWKLMVDSLPSFAALIRHALILGRGEAPLKKRDALEEAGRLFDFDPAPLVAVLEVREETRKRSQLDARSTFRGYYAGISRVCEQVDAMVKPKAEAQ